MVRKIQTMAPVVGMKKSLYTQEFYAMPTLEEIVLKKA
jgi:hypothetical protein